MPRIPADVMLRLASDLLVAGGIHTTEATTVASSLVSANLRGHDSHGVMRIPYYLDSLAKGEVRAAADFTILKQGPAVLLADGHWGFGQVQATRLTQSTIAKAKQIGIAAGTMIHCGHIGRLGEYCEMAAADGLVSMLMVNTHGHSRRVAPPGGRSPRLGTNPIAFGVPNGSRPLILDFGTSATAEGKVRVKKIAGQPVPEGWLLDAEGKPTTDPNSLYGNPPGTILPMGGGQAYKGFGLGLMVEIFAGALSGGVTIREVPVNQNGNCVYLQLIDPEKLGGAEHFAAEVTQLESFVRQCPRIDGVNDIQLPGDPERKSFAERTSHGIPMDDGNWAQLMALATNLGVTQPHIER